MNLPEPLFAPDHYTPCHYTTSRRVLAPDVNVTFHSVLQMSDEQFVDWTSRLRKTIVEQWDIDGCPPRIGLTDEELNKEWDRFVKADTAACWGTDDKGDTTLSTHATSGAFCTNWFPTMMKTRINYNEKDEGRSIYDFFVKDELFKKYLPYARRHFKRDSFYAYSQPIVIGDDHVTVPHLGYENAYDYVVKLMNNPSKMGEGIFDSTGEEWSFWLAQVDQDDEYTGYAEHLRGRKYLTLSSEEVMELWVERGKHPQSMIVAACSNLKFNDEGFLDPTKRYQPRIYRTDTRLFPTGFKSFRVSMCQYATNFPPMIARAIYDRYAVTNDDRRTVPQIWDPSSGWAGRLVGALTSKNRPAYIGSDPNTDHSWIDSEGIKHSKYTEIAAFAKERALTRPGDADYTARIAYFCLGAEEMQFHPWFVVEKGRIDVVFTSPPYFNREAYSEDEAQSYKRHSTFDAWCEGFLKPTIETAARWLRPGGYLLWNIADVKIGKTLLPLEEKSKHYALQAGLHYDETLKMLLMNMPGANRVNEEGTGTAKNTTVVKGAIVKYEPIFVFRKPL